MGVLGEFRIPKVKDDAIDEIWNSLPGNGPTTTMVN